MTMEPATSPELTVAPLPEPIPPPWGADGGAAAEEGGSSPEGAPEADFELTRAEAVDMLAGAVQVPFAVVALVRGKHWELTEVEAVGIAVPLARALPPAWLTSSILAASPWAVVAAATYRAVASRLALDLAAAAAAPAQEVPSDDTPAGSAAPSRSRPGDNGAGAGDAGRIGAVGVANPSEFEGAGLGLGDAVSGRPPSRPAGRRRGNAGAPLAPSPE